MRTLFIAVVFAVLAAATYADAHFTGYGHTDPNTGEYHPGNCYNSPEYCR